MLKSTLACWDATNVSSTDLSLLEKLTQMEFLLQKLTPLLACWRSYHPCWHVGKAKTVYNNVSLLALNSPDHKVTNAVYPLPHQYNLKSWLIQGKTITCFFFFLSFSNPPSEKWSGTPLVKDTGSLTLSKHRNRLLKTERLSLQCLIGFFF